MRVRVCVYVYPVVVCYSGKVGVPLSTKAISSFAVTVVTPEQIERVIMEIPHLWKIMKKCTSCLLIYLERLRRIMFCTSVSQYVYWFDWTFTLVSLLVFFPTLPEVVVYKTKCSFIFYFNPGMQNNATINVCKCSQNLDLYAYLKLMPHGGSDDPAALRMLRMTAPKK